VELETVAVILTGCNKKIKTKTIPKIIWVIWVIVVIEIFFFIITRNHFLPPNILLSEGLVKKQYKK